MRSIELVVEKTVAEAWKKHAANVTKGVGRCVCVGNYYIITQISRWVHSQQCRYPVLWPRAKGDSAGPLRCLEMVRGVPIRLIHVYYKVTFYRRRGLHHESLLQDCAQKSRTKRPVPWSCLPTLRILGDRHDFNSFLTCSFFFSSFSLSFLFLRPVARAAFILRDRWNILNIFVSPIEINDTARPSLSRLVKTRKRLFGEKGNLILHATRWIWLVRINICYGFLLLFFFK